MDNFYYKVSGRYCGNIAFLSISCIWLISYILLPIILQDWMFLIYLLVLIFFNLFFL
jgi:hypothetical protein